MLYELRNFHEKGIYENKCIVIVKRKFWHIQVACYYLKGLFF